MYQKKITMDVDRAYTSRIPSVQYDNNREVVIKLVNDGKPFDLTYVNPVLSCRKPDGEEIFNSAKIVDANKCELSVILTEQINAVAGQVACNLKLFGTEGFLVTSQEFYISVGPESNLKGVVSSSEFTQLRNMIDDVQNINNRFVSVNLKIDEVANKGTTVEVLERVTKEEIERQIADGTMANLTLADNSITNNKYKTGSISQSKLDNDLNEMVTKTKSLIDNYMLLSEGSNLLYPVNDMIKEVHVVGSRIAYTLNEKSSNKTSGVYAETNKLNFTANHAECFVLVGFNDDSIYQMGLHRSTVSVREHSHREYNSLGQVFGFNITKAVTIGDEVSVIREDNSINIYVNGSLVGGFTREQVPVAFSKNILGFLHVGNGNADLAWYKNIVSYGYLYDIARNSKMQKQFEKVQEELDVLKLSLGSEIVFQDISPLDMSEENQDNLVGNGIKANDTLVTKYDWVLLNEDVNGIKFKYVERETFLVLATNGSNALTLCINQNNALFGVLRNFSKDGRVDLQSFDLPTIGLGDYVSINYKDGATYVLNVYDSSEELRDTFEFSIAYMETNTDFTAQLGFLFYDATVGLLLADECRVSNPKRTNVESINLKVQEVSKKVETINKSVEQLKEAILNGGDNPGNVVDLIMFMGQSNMAGRGVASESPVVPVGHGYEFRAMSDPTKLYPIVEPFGVNENNSSSGVNESSKTGSMVSSFVINYYKNTKTPVVAVSCAKGGTRIDWWQPNSRPLNDAIARFKSAKSWLESNGYIIRHKYMVWCQGCSDGDAGTTYEQYLERIKKMIQAMVDEGIEKCFLVRIGNHRDNTTIYDEIMRAQTDLCKEYEHAVLVSTKLCDFAYNGLMKDSFHYKQEGYNIVGADAGVNTAFYVNNSKEPFLYDGESTRCPEKFDPLYITRKS